ncbi:MAG: hypothetical protein A2Z15_04445 [Chloroflexi bacterium RBG_16_50_11]|nr:MAG: hypothetical protein A2Z15_04445 [Chloroflexi bacterium RBG_16_50_11]
MAYWALDTWRSNDNNNARERNYWEELYTKQMIAIGWGRIDISQNPNKDEIQKSLKNEYSYYLEKNPAYAASIILNFINLTEDDNILICHGYSWNSDEKVRLYGTAKVTGGYHKGYLDKWLCFLHCAKIDKVKKEYIPKILLVEMLDGKESFRGTLRKMNDEQYNKILAWARP